MSTLARNIADARPKVVAALAVYCRDLDLAEEAFAQATERCLLLSDPPDNVTAWMTTAGKRKIIDFARKRQAEARAIEGVAEVSEMADIISLPEPIADERLRLIFICCHPAIALEARTALALKVICGLPVAEIARVFVTSEQTMFQRVTRAKTKVRDAGISFELPPRKAWGERLEAVLLTLELAYTVAYQDAAGERDSELAAEVERLAQMVAELLPDEPEALGLAALVILARSREKARVDGDGIMVPLSEQDHRQWDFDAIERARTMLDTAALKEKTGPYQIMASIQLTHARRAFDGETHWDVIAKLYDALAILRPGAMVALNRALAVAHVHGAQSGLQALDAIDASKLRSARPYHVARAKLLMETGQAARAADCLEAALALEPPRAERLFLEKRLREATG